MRKELKRCYEKLIGDKEKGLFSEVTIVEKEIDGKIEEVIMLRSDEVRKCEINELPETLSASLFGDDREVLGRMFIFYSGGDGEEQRQLGEESLAELVARM